MTDEQIKPDVASQLMMTNTEKHKRKQQMIKNQREIPERLDLQLKPVNRIIKTINNTDLSGENWKNK